MKSIAVAAVFLSFSLQLLAEPELTDISTYEALVMDETSGDVLAAGGPWLWDDQSSQSMQGTMAGTGRSIVLKCHDINGETIFGATLTGVTLDPLMIPPDPFSPPGPLGQVILTFYVEGDVVWVYLNHLSLLGKMVLLPAGDDPGTLAVAVDIKPGSDVNPFNVTAQGALPVAIPGTAGLDVLQIDPSSVRLAGASPLREPEIADIQGDGIPDLVFHFGNPDVAATLSGAADGETVGLQLTGTLMDGTPILGEDSIRVIRKAGKGK